LSRAVSNVKCPKTVNSNYQKIYEKTTVVNLGLRLSGGSASSGAPACPLGMRNIRYGVWWRKLFSTKKRQKARRAQKKA
jgi:hypothetical protein